MKKTNKKFWFTSLSVLSVAATPIAVISCSAKDNYSINTTTNALKNGETRVADANAGDAQASTTKAPYQPDTNLLDPKKGTNFQALEAYEGEIDMSVWRATPIMKKYDDAFMEQWINNAKVEGWRSIEDYQKYLQYKIEVNGHSGYDTFAGNSTPEENWISWNYGPGQILNTTYTAGVDSDIRPTWINAENESWNDIDNNIAWYQYDTGAEQFVFDENNIDNAWKRLINMQRLIPTSEAEIFNESTKPAEDGTVITRNMYMVDGVLMEHLPQGFHKYFYVTNDRSKYVRDDNGWKVVVTDRNKKDILSSVINPADSLNAGTKQPDGSYAGGKWKMGYKAANPAGWWAPKITKLVSVHSNNPLQKSNGKIEVKAIDYPDTYNKNTDHNRADLYDENGIAKNANDPETMWTGKYTLTHKEDSFSKLVAYPYSWFPQEKQENVINMDRFGQLATQAFTHPWNGGGYAFQWVEDGHGGHKIYKSLNALRLMIPDWRSKNTSKLTSHGDFEPANTMKFWANWHHVFPVKDWFVQETDIYKDTGL